MSSAPITKLTSEVGALIRFILRRDRIRIPIWIIAIAGSVILTAVSLPGVYENAAQRQARAELMANPATKAFAGPGIGLDDYTFGAMMTQEMMAFAAVTIALMSILLVVRHTRSDEAEGRTELVNAYAGNRHSTLKATIFVVSTVNIILGVVIAIGLGSLGIESITWASSWLYGAALAATGLVFTAIAALSAQLTQHSRGASGLAGLAIGVAYMLRALGDISGNFLSWLSPFGWAQFTKAYVDDTWWPLLISLAATALCLAAAVAIARNRDIGAGLLQAKAGRRRASALLRSPLTLALRLQRTSLIAWSVSLFIFGLVYGTLASDIEGFVAELEAFMPIGTETNILEYFLGMIVSVFAIMAMVFVIISISRMKSEEQAGRAEIILSTPVSRIRWVLSYVAVAFGGSIVVLLSATLGMALSAAIALSDTSMITRLIGAAFVYVPVLWLTVGLAVALFGLSSRAVNFTWLILAHVTITWMFGLFLKFPAWFTQLSPLEHIPAVPAEALQLAPLIAITFAGFAAFIFGMIRIRQRDITTS